MAVASARSKVRSHPSRVRELKLIANADLDRLKQSHPSRVRELKRLGRLVLSICKPSHPSRVRELKLDSVLPEDGVPAVAPLPGA